MIEIINRQSRYWIKKTTFRRLLNRLTKHYNKGEVVVTLAFVSNRTIHDLNKRFAGEDRPTDVLSFPMNEESADGRFYLGDIIISVPYAFKQCLKMDHGLERELEYLTIHGFLHLLGFEHSEGLEEEEERIRNLLIGE
jgi:probable rRNA maturation factor